MVNESGGFLVMIRLLSSLGRPQPSPRSRSTLPEGNAVADILCGKSM